MLYEETTELPYHRLTITPLAKETRLCGLPPNVLGFVLGLYSFVVDVIPPVYITYKQLDRLSFLYDFASFFTSCVHSWALSLLVLGTVRDDSRYYYFWFKTFAFQVVVGKFVLAFQQENIEFGIYLVLSTLFDIPLTCMLPVFYGKATMADRNRRYLLIRRFRYCNPDASAYRNLQVTET